MEHRVDCRFRISDCGFGIKELKNLRRHGAWSIRRDERDVKSGETKRSMEHGAEGKKSEVGGQRSENRIS